MDNIKKVSFFGYLSNKPDFEMFFREFAETGKRSGFEVSGINIGRPAKGPTGFPIKHLPFPANPTFYGWVAKRAEDTRENRTWSAIAEFEPKSIEKFGLTTVNTVLENLYVYLREYFSQTNPDIVILGHQFAAPYQVALHVCSDLKIPVIFNHPGVLNGTMCFEGAGQMAESELFDQWEEITRREISDSHLEASRCLVERLRTGRITRPGKENKVSDEELGKVEALRKSRTVVLYAGIADHRTGVQPRSYPRSRAHSAWVESSVDGLKQLVRASEELDFKIVFKPHPIEAGTYDECFEHRNVVVVKEITINRLLDYSDAFATICSSSAYEALLKGVPTLLLGKMQASLCPAVSSAGSAEDLVDFFRRIVDEKPKVSEDDVVRHVAYLLRDYLFVSDPALGDLPLRRLPDFWEVAPRLARVPAVDSIRGRHSGSQKPGLTMYAKRCLMLLSDLKRNGVRSVLDEVKEEGRFLLNC